MNGELAVSAITFWEVGILVKKGRLATNQSLLLWRNELLAAGLTEIPVDGIVGIAASELDLPQADPADRLIVATALARNAVLVTADERILAWSGALLRHDARL